MPVQKWDYTFYGFNQRTLHTAATHSPQPIGDTAREPGGQGWELVAIVRRAIVQLNIYRHANDRSTNVFLAVTRFDCLW